MALTLNEYQTGAERTMLPSARTLMYLVPGLAAEAGEVAGKYAKHIRDSATDPVEFEETMIKELGDVLWFVATTAHFLGHSLEEVAEINLDKLGSRKERGVITGSGDDR